MDINKVYTFLQYLADKDQSGNITPKEFNLSLPRAFTECIMKRYNNVNSVQPDRQGWQKNQKITDDLKFLLVRNDVTHIGIDGRLSLPEDYLHLSSIVYNYKYEEDGETVVLPNKVDVVNDNEISAFLGSTIYSKRIKAKKYVIGAFYSDHIQLYPKNLGVVDFTYLRKPKEPKWAFNIVNGRPVYDELNSVDLEAPEELANEIIVMCASYLGINLREPQLIEYAEMLKEQGV
jgi:hypothetical protein